MKKIIVLSGGLGNQLFQLAAAEQLFNEDSYQIYTEKLNRYSTVRKPDSILITKYQHRIAKISFLHKQILNSKLISSIKSPAVKSIFNRMIKTNFLSGYFHDCIKFNKGIFKLKKVIEEQNRDELIKMKNKLSNSQTCVAIHIRYGDYLNYNTFWIIDEKFVEKSLNKFQKIDELMVFCEEVPQNLLKVLKKYCCNVRFSKDLQLKDHEEFLLMSTYSNLIISNSTFSFWASIINNSSKKVYGPEKYFRSKSNEQWVKNCTKMNIKLIKC